MTGTYTTTLKSQWFHFQKGYVKVDIQANDLNTFVKVVKHIKQLEEIVDD